VVAESLERSYPSAVGFFFTNPELIMELWTVTADIPKISTAGYAPARDLVDQYVGCRRSAIMGHF